MKKAYPFIFIILSILLAITACEDSLDLKDLIETQVKIYNNPKHYLTVESTTGGNASPGSAVQVADEVPVVISATASSGYAFKGWEFIRGESSAVLGEAVTNDSNTVTISGSDVIIQAVFVVQPEVISIYPEGNDIARNMPVRIIFSKIVDESSINSETIQVFDIQANRQISGRLEVSGSEVRFYAEDSSFEQTAQGLYLWESNHSYKVYIREDVLDQDGIALLEEESWAFLTGTDEDNTDPVI